MKAEDHKRKPSTFEWVPYHERMRNAKTIEKRKPFCWLAREGDDLYFINETDEVLTTVTTSSGGYCTADDDVVSMSENNGYTYKSVQPKEAVKIDELDDFFDGDFILQSYVSVESEKLGSLELRSSPEKGGSRGNEVLLWDTGETPW